MEGKIDIGRDELVEGVTVHLENGFQSGSWIAEFDGKEFKTIDSTGSCTYHDDEEVCKDVKLPANFKGVIGGYHGVSSMTTINNVEFVGFSEEELQAKPPEKGFVSDEICFGVTDVKEASTMKDYLEAKARGLMFISIEELGDGVHSLPFRWGDQDADCLVVIKNGQIKLLEKGSGDSTPSLVEGWEKLYNQGDYHAMFTTPYIEKIRQFNEDRAKEQFKKEEEEDKYYESFYPKDPKGVKRKFNK